MLNYTIVRLTSADKERVIEFLAKTFFKDEPLNIAVGISSANRCRELEDYCTMPLSQGVSLAAVNDQNQILGLTINSVIYKREASSGGASEDEDECPNPQFKIILSFLKWLEKKCDIFSKFPNINKFLDLSIISVDPNCRGQGLAKKLVYDSIDLALSNDIDIVKADCTSHFSAKALTRLGFSCIYSVSYDEYVGPDNKPIFQTPEPHNSAEIYVMNVHQFEDKRQKLISP